MELRPSDRDRFHRYPLKVDGFPDPRRLPSAGSSFEPFSDLAATRTTTQVSAPFRPLRVHRFGLGPFPRPQPRPRTASGARHRLPTSATNPQNKGTPGKRRFHARSSPFRRSPFAQEPVKAQGCERYGTGAFASDLAPVRAPPHRPEDNEPACAQWRRGRLDRLPSTSCHPLRGRRLWAACDFERGGRGLLPSRRANGRAFRRPRCLRSLKTSPGALGPQGAARLGPPPLSRREPATRHAIFRHPRRVA